MLPKVAIDVVSRDKTESGRKASERSMAASAKKIGAIGEGGFASLGKRVESLTRFRTLSFGFDAVGRSLSTVGGISRDTAGAVEGMTRNVLTFGGAAPKAFGAAASGAATAAGAVAGLSAAIIGLGVGTYMLGDKWAKLGSDVGRTAKDLGVSTRDLQARRGAGERFGVSSDQVDSSIEGLGSTLYDAKYGANNLALGAMNQLGLKMKEREDGSIDVNAMMDDLADAIARQKNPMVQRKLAAIFGVSGMLPALRQGSGALKAEGDDYLKTGAAFTDAEVAKSEAVRKKSVRLRQQLGAIEKNVGVAAESATGAAADAGVDGLRGLGRKADQAGSSITGAARDFSRGAKEAGRRLSDGADRSARRMDQGFEAFKARIIGKESRGRQLDRRGRPLTSPKNAIGRMQVLEKTGIAAARRAGIPWDPQRFRYDADYNEQIGTAELSRLYEKYDGNQVLAAAAYNAGEGRLDGMWTGKGKSRRYYRGWLERFGDPRKGEISDQAFADRIPFPETRDYANKTAAMGAAKAEVTINIKGAPPGTVARSSAGPGVEVAVNVARSLDGTP